MNREQKYLHDILKAIGLVKEFAQDVNSFEEYCRDFKTQSAIERQLVIIGEALFQLSKLENYQPLENHEKIVGFRHRLVHAYDSIDNSIVWAILQKHLQALEVEVRKRMI